MKLKLEVTKRRFRRVSKRRNLYKTWRRNVVVSHINMQAMYNVYEEHNVVDPDFDDENFLTSFNYCMDVNEPFRAETNTSLGNHLPSGHDNQHVANELRRLELLRKIKSGERKRVRNTFRILSHTRKGKHHDSETN